MGGRHRRTGFNPVAVTGNGAVDQRAGRGNAPIFGDATLVIFLLIVFIQPRHGQPVPFQVGLKIRQCGAHAGIGHPTVTGTEHVNHATARHIGRSIQPCVLVVVLCIGGVQAVEGLVVHVFGLAAPTVVDGAYPGIGERVISGLEIQGVRLGAKQKAVVLIGIGHIQIGIKGDTVHADAIAGGGNGARDVSAVGIVTRVELAAD